MNLPINIEDWPVHVRFDHAMSDSELIRFCGQNELLRVERDANGEILLMSPVGMEGAGHEFELAVELGIWAREDGRGRGYGSNAGFTLPDTSMRSPDAAWLSDARAGLLSKEQRTGFARVCPEFIVEVRSATDALKPLQEKMRMWLANGAELAWLVDPQRKVVEIFRAGQDAEVYEDPTSVLGTGPVQGFELILSRIWAASGPRAA